MSDDKPLFRGKEPCSNCPYRTDAPLQHWDQVEFENLLTKDRTLIGAVFRCHKKDGSVCRGWLMNQRDRGCPSIALRLSLAKQKVSNEFLSQLSSPVSCYETIEDMIRANYPEMPIPLRELNQLDFVYCLLISNKLQQKFTDIIQNCMTMGF